MDWIGSITPTCLITRVIYILLLVDYFTRFIWVKGYLKYIVDKVIDIYKNFISPIVGDSKVVYSDNGSHFINQKI